jgi:hypothetical protein
LPVAGEHQQSPRLEHRTIHAKLSPIWRPLTRDDFAAM